LSISFWALFGKFLFSDYLDRGEMSQLFASQEKILLTARASLGARLAKETNPFKKLLLSSKLHSIESWHRWLTESASPCVEAGGADRK